MTQLRIFITSLLIIVSPFSFAQSQYDAELFALQKSWAIATYSTPKLKQDKRFAQLNLRAAELAASDPSRAEAYIWQAIINMTHSNEVGEFFTVRYVNDARDLLKKAEKINSSVMNGLVYTSLGQLYYEIPGWPLSFGDDEKAKQYLDTALKANPNGIDSNYYYAGYLMKLTRYQEAIRYFEKSLKAADRPEHPLADKGRRADARANIVEAKKIISGKDEIDIDLPIDEP